jgi:hypothetical protein
VVVCWWRFRLVLVLLVWLFLRLFVAVVRVRGVLLPLLLVWVALCLWCRLWALVLLGLVLWLLASAVLVLLPVVVCFGWLRLFLFLLRLWAVSLVYFSFLVAHYWIFKDCF